MAALSAAFGLGGRSRRAGAPVERARTNVRKRIALAIRRVGATCPAIKRHLDRALRTGTYCVYDPDR